VKIHWTAKSVTVMFVSLIVTSKHLPATRLRHSHHRLHLRLLPFLSTEWVWKCNDIRLLPNYTVRLPPPTGLTRPLYLHGTKAQPCKSHVSKND
jgi:hypothetical protein